ncbi:hypothetical protein [Microvirga tunisiensis]|uniref:Uncharacterized protein n=1 Tax=Microvirga tunisiensis TaxID=2108360 RepID=A0A5N7MB37_9HYPH|nr:hypothetical protein [Microvirga tunisiensis]MPR08156.1 hypothetical protein [Microvirga tunisiensis]MPR24131.1 hypothetical protein [Microvirga tunisiensis]
MTNRRRNEGRACDAVLQHLEQRTGRTRRDLRIPERMPDMPPVELLVTLGEQPYALEHTLIQPFREQIEWDRYFTSLTTPVQQAVEGHLPGRGTFTLLLPTNVRLPDPRALTSAQQAVTDWILEKARELAEQAPPNTERNYLPRGHSQEIQETLTGIPFPLKLVHHIHWARSPRHDGRFFITRYVPEELESLRLSNLRISLFGNGRNTGKCPKLLQCKERFGAMTVLVLETDDFVLSNHVVIREALQNLLVGRVDAPDLVFLIDTTGAPWTLWHLMSQDNPDPDDQHYDFPVDQLQDLMDRSHDNSPAT